MKIHSPAAGYTGTDRYGETVLDFKDGVAEHMGDLPPGIRQYLLGAGYGIGSAKATAPEPAPEPADPRDIGDGTGVEPLGTQLRDAAVDPRSEDFLAPINAGEANPHGSQVVSPEIHASGPAGIVPGNVFVEDPEKQEKREKDFAQARLIEQVNAGDAVADAVPDVDGLSDPGSVQQGVEAAKEVAKQEKAESADEPAPAKKAAAKKTTAKKAAAKKS
jgi:hypothetical protein